MDVVESHTRGCRVNVRHAPPTIGPTLVLEPPELPLALPVLVGVPVGETVEEMETVEETVEKMETMEETTVGGPGWM